MLNKTCNEKLRAFHHQAWCLGHWVIDENDETAHALEVQAFENRAALYQVAAQLHNTIDSFI